MEKLKTEVDIIEFEHPSKKQFAEIQKARFENALISNLMTWKSKKNIDPESFTIMTFKGYMYYPDRGIFIKFY